MMKTIESILQEHTALLARREAARQAFVALDADAQALTTIIREQGAAGAPGASLAYNTQWLKAGERASEAFFKTLLPQASWSLIDDAHARWKHKLARLLAA